MESRELVTSHTCALLQRRRMASTGGSGSTSCSIFTQLRRIIAASLVDVAMTMPGQSRSLMCLSKCTSWRHLRMHQTLWWGEHDTHRKSQGCRIISSPRTHLVTPGVAPTLQARARFKLLIKLLLPTLGKPVDGYFTLEKVQFHTDTAWRATPCEAYLRHQQWWPFLCPGYGNSCQGASSGNPHPNRRCYSAALQWPVSLEHYCVSADGKRNVY